MQDEGLREALERLRTELGRGEIQDAGLRGRVGAIIGDVERKLEQPEDEESHATLVSNLREVVERFGLEHPRATSILNRIMQSLGEAGI